MKDEIASAFAETSAFAEATAGQDGGTRSHTQATDRKPTVAVRSITEYNGFSFALTSYGEQGIKAAVDAGIGGGRKKSPFHSVNIRKTP